MEGGGNHDYDGWDASVCDVTMMTMVYSILMKYNECPCCKDLLIYLFQGTYYMANECAIAKQFIKERSVHLLRKRLLLIKCQEPQQKYNHCLL